MRRAADSPPWVIAPARTRPISISEAMVDDDGI
jgi:hypothetical protein